MCLHLVNAKKPKSSGYGWKVYLILDNKIRSSFQRTLVTRKKWMKARVRGDEPGFHIYLSRDKAEGCIRWYERFPVYGFTHKIFRVRYRGAIKQGDGDGGYTEGARVVVANEIYVY